MINLGNFPLYTLINYNNIAVMSSAIQISEHARCKTIHVTCHNYYDGSVVHASQIARPPATNQMT